MTIYLEKEGKIIFSHAFEERISQGIDFGKVNRVRSMDE